MAKHGSRVLPARKQDRDDSLLVRSAESLGRVIGSLQRQLQDTSKRASSLADDAMKAMPELPRIDDMLGTRKRSTRKRTTTRRSATRKRKSAARSGGKRTSAAARRTSTSRKPSARKASKKR